MEFEVYVRDAQRALWRFAVVLCDDPILAEDIVTDVLGRAYERWDQVSRADHVHAYVRRMVVNEYLSWRRRRVRTVLSPDLLALAGSTEDHSTQHAERAQLLAELGRLPRKQRAALVLHYYEGLTVDEIADVLGVAPGSVRSNVSRGLATLRVGLGVDPLSSQPRET